MTVTFRTMTNDMQQPTTGMSYLLNDRQCLRSIERPRMGWKNASKRATHSLPILIRQRFYHHQADPTAPVGYYIHLVWMQFASRPGHCMAVYPLRSRTQRKKMWIFSRYFTLFPVFLKLLRLVLGNRATTIHNVFLPIFTAMPHSLGSVYSWRSYQ